MKPVRIFSTYSLTDPNAPVLAGVAVTGTNTYYSQMWSAMDNHSYSLQVAWTGTPTGTFTLQISDKPNPDETNDNDWVTSTEVTVTNPAGSASGFRGATTAGPGFRKRLKYVNASGSGTLTGWVTVNAA